MKEELTTKMHSEFTLSADAEEQESAFAVFDMLNLDYPLPEALRLIGVRIEQVRPHLAAYNKLAPKQVTLE